MPLLCGSLLFPPLRPSPQHPIDTLSSRILPYLTPLSAPSHFFALLFYCYHSVCSERLEWSHNPRVPQMTCMKISHSHSYRATIPYTITDRCPCCSTRAEAFLESLLQESKYHLRNTK